jgi:hypothetical protein
MKKGLFPAILIILFLAAANVSGAETKQETISDVVKSGDIPYGVIDPSFVPAAYSGEEFFRYDISYTGGFKLGELHLALRKNDEEPDSFIIDARVTTENGIFSNVYPIEDRHVTKVSGAERLPFHYEVWQKEGYSYEAHRITLYDQEDKRIYYYVNDNPVEEFDLSGTTQNEFSSFFASRVMGFKPGDSFIVPTFADEKRIEVVVRAKKIDTLKKTVLGTVDAVVVEPIMTFSGLYDKRGDTVIWYTDDQCRVPVKINSKILIGSLTAKLVSYRNPACPDYDGSVLEKYRKKEQNKE